MPEHLRGVHHDLPNNLVAPALSPDELHLIRQWFDAVQDAFPKCLERPDYLLARRLYEALEMRVPHSISENC